MTVSVRRQYNQILNQTNQVISQSTGAVADTIEASIGYALNSIQVTSIGISRTMEEPIIKNPQEMLEIFIEKTPFSSIEYIRADGINFTNAGEPFDASNREYYIQGMKGNTGIWVNFSPKYSLGVSQSLCKPSN